ncbi:unnamed protein product [Cladocopium goreaui]|uniref:Uncharacterized protein n=1 Tax=Cladocopium goreaui TaxID=2562237 RepID=A0A9P1G3X9_9DINO|nr:unnamed protein product [Cladocopium goreaui]
MMRRIKREAALLQAVSSDNAAEVSLAMGIPEAGGTASEDVAKEQQELLALKVKPTFNDPKDASAFFHSIASYGMEFGLNENITQLARRNDKTQAFQLLLTLEKQLGLAPPRDLDLEAALLAAVAKNQGEEIKKLLQSEAGQAVLQLQVKETFNDPAELTAFYHSVATFGLKFQLGDSLYDLAVRNERPAAAQSLASTTETPAAVEAPLEVLVMNTLNGQELCRVSASNTWTILQLAQDVASKVPTPGCRVFLLGGAALTTGTALGDLLEKEGAPSLELSSLVRSNVEGIYSAKVQPDDEMDGPLLGGPGGRLAGGLAGRRLRRRPRDMQLELKMDGNAIFEFSERPIDRGHCAPPSGGYLLSGTGMWSFEGPGVKVRITDAQTGHFMRCIPSLDRTSDMTPFSLTFSMVKEDQMDLVEFADEKAADGFSRRPRCPLGTAFLKQPEGERGRLVNFR